MERKHASYFSLLGFHLLSGIHTVLGFAGLGLRDDASQQFLSASGQPLSVKLVSVPQLSARQSMKRNGERPFRPVTIE